MTTSRIKLSALQAHHIFAALEALPKPLDAHDGDLAKQFTAELGFTITGSHVRHARTALEIPAFRPRVTEIAKSRITLILDAIAALESRVSKLEGRKG